MNLFAILWKTLKKKITGMFFLNFYIIETSSLRIPFIILHSILVGDNLIPVVEVLVTFCKNHSLLTTMSQNPFKTADYLSKNALYITH